MTFGERSYDCRDNDFAMIIFRTFQYGIFWNKVCSVPDYSFFTDKHLIRSQVGASICDNHFVAHI